MYDRDGMTRKRAPIFSIVDLRTFSKRIPSVWQSARMTSDAGEAYLWAVETSFEIYACVGRSLEASLISQTELAASMAQIRFCGVRMSPERRCS